MIVAASHETSTREKHLASWVGVCPGNKQSGGKRLSGKTTHGNPYLRAVLGGSQTIDHYLSAQLHRIARRRVKQKAVIAVAHRILVILYHMLRDGRPDSDLGPEYFERLEATQIERYHVRRLEQLGYTVTLTPAPAA